MPVFGSDSTIIKEGWLWKQGGRVRNWKRRWFVITDGCLFYFETRTVRRILNEILIKNLFLIGS
jgi:cytohesin